MYGKNKHSVLRLLLIDLWLNLKSLMSKLLLACIRQVPHSNISQYTDHSDRGFRGFPTSFLINSEILGLRPISSCSLFRCFTIIFIFARLFGQYMPSLTDSVVEWTKYSNLGHSEWETRMLTTQQWHVIKQWCSAVCCDTTPHPANEKKGQ
jgi:hypothetical protein